MWVGRERRRRNFPLEYLNSVDVIPCILVPLNDIIIFIMTHMKILESIEIHLMITL